MSNNNNGNLNAVLVNLSISVFSNTRQDPQITDEVKLKKALGNGAGKWVKYKLPDEALTPIRKVAGIIRQFNYDHTSPWEEGKRLLAAAARESYADGIRTLTAEFDAAVAEFGTQYDNWIALARIMHATTFEPSDYPSWNLCRTMFAVTCEYYPVPRPEHFSRDMQALYGTALNAITERKIQEAVSDTWERLLRPVQAMAEKLAQPDAIFRDTLVENVKEMTALVPMLNLTGDRRLAEAAQVIQDQLANLDAESLRESKVERKEVAERAAQIVARFGQLGKRKLAA